MGIGPDAAALTTMLKRAAEQTTPDWVDVLAALPLFAEVPRRRLRKVATLAEVRTFGPGDWIIRKGDASDGFYLILGGRAKVTGRSSPQALGIGDYFGEMALLDGEPRSATITATDELQTMRIAREPFLRLLEQEPQIAVAIMKELARRVRRAEQALTA